MRILIADSDPKRMDLYRRILEQDKHQILTAKNRLEADYALRSDKNIDVVVYDLRIDMARLVELHNIYSVVISDSKESEHATFKETNFAIRKFNERTLENTLRSAVKKVTELELAVA